MMPALALKKVGKNGLELRDVKEFVEEDVLGSRPWHIAKVVAQGTGNTVHLAATGETVSDGHNTPVCVSYTSPAVGAAGGPAITDTVLVWDLGPRNSILIGKIYY